MSPWEVIQTLGLAREQIHGGPAPSLFSFVSGSCLLFGASFSRIVRTLM